MLQQTTAASAFLVICAYRNRQNFRLVQNYRGKQIASQITGLVQIILIFRGVWDIQYICIIDKPAKSPLFHKSQQPPAIKRSIECLCFNRGNSVTISCSYGPYHVTSHFFLGQGADQQYKAASTAENYQALFFLRPLLQSYPHQHSAYLGCLQKKPVLRPAR